MLISGDTEKSCVVIVICGHGLDSTLFASYPENNVIMGYSLLTADSCIDDKSP